MILIARKMKETDRTATYQLTIQETSVISGAVVTKIIHNWVHQFDKEYCCLEDLRKFYGCSKLIIR